MLFRSNGGTVTAITRTAGGTGYTVAPTITISAPTTAGGVQATATCTVTAGVVDTTFTITNAGSGYVEPFEFVLNLSKHASPNDQIIPCSSGGAFTTMMQAFEIKEGQVMITDKGLASMGYGLSGAIGASIANPEVRTILTEGDGGFAQNFQELGTAALRKLNLKIFIYSNQGYASIRTMQKSYFNEIGRAHV